MAPARDPSIARGNSAARRPRAARGTARWETSSTEGPLYPLWVKRNPPRVTSLRFPTGASIVTGREIPVRAAYRCGSAVSGVSAG